MDEQRKPAVLICGVDPRAKTGGHASYVKAHALALQSAGFASHVFCVGDRTDTVSTDFGMLHVVATPVRQLLFAPAYHGPVSAAIADFLGRVRHTPPFSVHGFFLWSACGAAAVKRLAGRGVQAVPIASAFTTVVHEWRALLRSASSHGDRRAALFYWSRYPWVRTATNRLERRGYERAGLVLVNYASVARLLADAHGDRLRVRQIPYAAPAAFGATSEPARWAGLPSAGRSTSGPDQPPPLIVSLSRHEPRKGVDVLLRALAVLRTEQVPFRACLMGPGRLLAAHRRLAQSLGLGDHVSIPGYVDLPWLWLQRADIFALPSLEEGSGSVSVLEALQAGPAVVASRCDGIPEDLTDGHDALLVSRGSVAELAGALRKLLGDPDLRARLARNARCTYEQRFTAAVFTDALRDVYADVGVRP